MLTRTKDVFYEKFVDSRGLREICSDESCKQIYLGEKSSNRLQHTCYRKWKKEDKRFLTKEKSTF